MALQFRDFSMVNDFHDDYVYAKAYEGQTCLGMFSVRLEDIQCNFNIQEPFYNKFRKSALAYLVSGHDPI